MTPAEAFQKYKFYHIIELGNGIKTPGLGGVYVEEQQQVLTLMDKINFKNKSVLDTGCRDGLFSLSAEKRGASKVIGIDNDLSPAAVEFILPYLKSKVTMYEMNIYDLKKDSFGKFDIVLFTGILYHLRSPFQAFKAIADVMNDGGILVVETAIFIEITNMPLLYCPNNPYDPTSVSIFNPLGLTETLHTFGFRHNNDSLISHHKRIATTFTFDLKLNALKQSYWWGKHNVHNDETATVEDFRG